MQFSAEASCTGLVSLLDVVCEVTLCINCVCLGEQQQVQSNVCNPWGCLQETATLVHGNAKHARHDEQRGPVLCTVTAAPCVQRAAPCVQPFNRVVD
jgi:hypothetical protein